MNENAEHVMETILITGANGFVGAPLCTALIKHGRKIRPVVRAAKAGSQLVIGDILPDTDWRQALHGCDALIHLAARVHVMKESTMAPRQAFQTTNVDATLNLARQAADEGIRRFIFLSSIKVNGESTTPGKSFSASDTPNPQGYYAKSKLDAELGLRQIALKTGMEVVIIRPPLVYGPGVKANFRSMMLWIHKGIPLPLGSIRLNRRSLIAIDNLIDLIITCIDHPHAKNQTFLASDREDMSTTMLLQRLGAAMHKPVRLVPISPGLLKNCARLFGKQYIAERLLESLQVNIEPTCKILDWKPVVSVDEGLALAVSIFCKSR